VEEKVDKALAKTFASEPRPVRQIPVAPRPSNA
jgi:hypothetical protein